MMSSRGITAVLLALAAAGCHAGSVSLLNGRNFHEAVEEKQLWLVKFYAPWCGHCKRLAPVLDEVARSFDEKSCRFAKVDCTVDRGLCDEYFVKGFPMLKVLHEGKTWEYKGPRNKEAITELVHRMRGPASKDIHNVGELEEALAPPGRVFFFAGLPLPSKKEQPFWDAARNLMHADYFGTSRDQPLIKHAIGQDHRQWASDVPWLARLERREAPRFFPITDQTTPHQIEEFVQANRLPTMNLVGRHSFYDLANAGKPLLMLVLDPATLTTPGERLTLENAVGTPETPGAWFMAMARRPNLQKRFVFALLDAKEHADTIEEEYGFNRSSVPRMVVMRKTTRGERAWTTDAQGDCTQDATMARFVHDVIENNVFWNFEGIYGLPDRWWRIMKKHAPFLGHLDPYLPRYALTTLVAMLVLKIMWKIMMIGPPGGFPPPMDELDAHGDAKKPKQS